MWRCRSAGAPSPPTRSSSPRVRGGREAPSRTRIGDPRFQSLTSTPTSSDASSTSSTRASAPSRRTT
eukprot:scaffold132717_cov33-Tisochrysis_lutea.AAC.1